MSAMRSMVVALCAAAGCAGAAVRIGDPREQVLAELGPPSGHIRGSDFELLYYPSGTVQLRGGRVVALQMRTAEQARAEREAELLARRREEAERRHRRAQGERELRALIESEEYRALTPAEQIEQLARFAQAHPGVSIAAPLLAAQRALEEEQRRERRSRELAEELEAQREESARRERRRVAPPYLVSGNTTVWYVEPWVYWVPAWGVVPPLAGPDCRHRVETFRPTGAGTPTWPYNFGMGGAEVRIGPRQPSMGW
ncbi:MAG: hypothetical protein N2652_07635 [Kiritimatiellae bacterium]|nr:hypothetical protein [Kiritimatiellia bacterium]